MTIQATITVEDEGYTIQWDGEPPPVGRYRMVAENSVYRELLASQQPVDDEVSIATANRAEMYWSPDAPGTPTSAKAARVTDEQRNEIYRKVYDECDMGSFNYRERLAINATIKHTEAALSIAPDAEPVAIKQFRVRYCADWYDGVPDYSDGKDYETRVVYAAPLPAKDAAHWQFLAEEWERQCDTAMARAAEWEARHDIIEAELNELRALPAQIEHLNRTVEAAHENAASFERSAVESWRQFKNFHRLLCERFCYTHDEKDWLRDQVSLIEWIAALPAKDAVGEATMQDAAQEQYLLGEIAARDEEILRLSKIIAASSPPKDAETWEGAFERLTGQDEPAPAKDAVGEAALRNALDRYEGSINEKPESAMRGVLEAFAPWVTITDDHAQNALTRYEFGPPFHEGLEDRMRGVLTEFLAASSPPKDARPPAYTPEEWDILVMKRALSATCVSGDGPLPYVKVSFATLQEAQDFHASLMASRPKDAQAVAKEGGSPSREVYGSD